MDHNSDEDVWYVVKWRDEVTGESNTVRRWFETYEDAAYLMKSLEQVDKNHNITRIKYWVDQVST